MINNFEYIKEHMKFLNDRSFYFVQILKRKKENPELKSYSQPIESFYIFNTEQFERVMPHIVEKCEQNRARAYIKMNTLDAQSVGLEAISVLSQEIRKENWHGMSKAFNSACGICGKQNGVEKLYLIDLDDGYADRKDEIIKFIEELKPINYREHDEYGHTVTERIDKVKMIVPTRHGIHLLASGFDKQTFKQAWPSIDVHDDGITLLYFPECCCDKVNSLDTQSVLTRTQNPVCPNCGKELTKFYSENNTRDAYVCTNNLCQICGLPLFKTLKLNGIHV